MKTIKEKMDAFEAEVWSKDKPALYCIAAYQHLLEENQRLTTVMTQALYEIDSMWQSHISNATANDAVQQLVALMENLNGEARGIYLDHLPPVAREEFLERVRNKTILSDSEG